MGIRITKELHDQLKLLGHALLDKNGHEQLDPDPVFVDVTPRPPSLKEQIQRLMRAELSAQAAAQQHETFEEADDFDVDEDPDPVSAYEMKDMVEELPVDKPAAEVTPEELPEEPVETPVEDSKKEEPII